MSTIAFDRFTYIEELKANGFTQQQAEGLAKAASKTLAEPAQELVTKDYLDARMQSLMLDMQSLGFKLAIGLGTFLGTLITILHVID